MRSHGLPRSSGRHAQIRVGCFPPFYIVTFLSSVKMNPSGRNHQKPITQGCSPRRGRPFVRVLIRIYVRSCSVSVSVVFVVYYNTLVYSRNHGLTLNMSTPPPLHPSLLHPYTLVHRCCTLLHSAALLHSALLHRYCTLLYSNPTPLCSTPPLLHSALIPATLLDSTLERATARG